MSSCVGESSCSAPLPYYSPPPYFSPQTPLAARRNELEMDSLSLVPSVKDALPPPPNLGNRGVSYKRFNQFIHDTLKLLGRHPIEYVRARDRHINITPFAFNQVLIDEGTTGLNGSWISYPDNDFYMTKPCIRGKYIAISAPAPSNFSPFMRMIQQESIPLIISLSAFQEGDKIKAHPYLPYEETQLLIGCERDDEEVYQVFCKQVHPSTVLSEGWILEQRDFALKLKGSPTLHHFSQLHLPNWKDFSPGAVEGIANLVQYVHNYCEERSILAPIVVHCSGGSRTHTARFLTAKRPMRRLIGGREVRIFDIAVQSRLQRYLLGGDQEQYEMVYKVVDYFKRQEPNTQED